MLFPKFRGDLVQCALVAERMKAGAIESIRYLRNPLDVLAQQIVAMVSERPRTVDEVAAVIRRSAAFSVAARLRAARRSWTCSPAATPPTRSPSCGRG